ncbi:E3 ubiquitin-protein ligase rnf168 [Brachyhypopomus gauderio]|uniref:E3 ubiquitin-protein ligase rnf168 n=1 Tax=Brachyhypopomus gauderio TaxID=698409 RepID=UPI004041DD44
MPPVSETDMQLVHEGPGKLVRADCLCPVCLEIFLEPVTLPCKHTFCKACFLETVDKANMCCPLCRKRVSSWARLNSRNKTLVNAELWRRIQEDFPVQCQRRLNGVEDEDDMNALIPKPRVSQPGELRQEYEDEISKFAEEKRALEEAERKASEDYIQRLLAEEQQRVLEQRRRQEERLEEDERLARVLSKELNPSKVLEPQRDIKQNNAASDKKKKPVAGHIEKFLCAVPYGQPHCETSSASIVLTNEEAILNTRSTLSPCPAEPCGLEAPASTSCCTPRDLNSDPDPGEQLPATAESSGLSKRKMEDAGLACEADPNKRQRGCPWGGPSQRELMVQEEEALRRRWQQEELDRQLALRLQRELDRENAVDRRKGSADGYPLRQRTSPAEATAGISSPGEDSRVARKGEATPSARPNGKTSKERHSPPSASTAQTRTKQKQTTLTEIYPGFGNGM